MSETTDTFSHPALPGILTTRHPASSYRKPVYVIDGVAYGRFDSLPTQAPSATHVETVEMHLVAICRRHGIRHPLIEAFLGRPLALYPGLPEYDTEEA